jgi:hypothetical protein
MKHPTRKGTDTMTQTTSTDRPATALHVEGEGGCIFTYLFDPADHGRLLDLTAGLESGTVESGHEERFNEFLRLGFHGFSFDLLQFQAKKLGLTILGFDTPYDGSLRGFTLTGSIHIPYTDTFSD